jgi:hypothetical protein
LRHPRHGWYAQPPCSPRDDRADRLTVTDREFTEEATRTAAAILELRERDRR